MSAVPPSPRSIAPGLCACALVAWLGAAPAPARQGPPLSAETRSTRIAHIRLTGDFETMSATKRVAEALEHASRDGDMLVVLELDGARGRSDVALALAEAVRGAHPPVAAYLSGGRARRVGAAQACVALAAPHVLIEPGTSVRASPGDDRRDLAPDKTDWERVTRELSGLVFTRLRTAGAPADLAQVLVGFPNDARPAGAWVLPPAEGPGEYKLVFEDPAGTADAAPAPWRLVSHSARGRPELVITADRLRAIRAVEAFAPSEAAVVGALGVKGSLRTAVTIDATLDRPRRNCAADLTAADDLFRRAVDDLGLPPPPKAEIGEDRYRKAARAARDKLARVSDLLGQIEKLVAEYPELTREPAPGQTDVGGKPSVYATRWRSTIQKRRDEVKRLDAKAATFESPEHK